MVFKKKSSLLIFGAFAFVFLCALVLSLLVKSSYPYLLTGSVASLLFFSLLHYLSPRLKTWKKKESKSKLGQKIASVFADQAALDRLFHQVLALLLLLIFVIRTLSKHDYLEGISALQSDIMAPYQVALSAILDCWWFGILIETLTAQFLSSPLFRAIEKFIVTPILLLISLFLPFCLMGVSGALTSFSPQALLMAFEYALMVGFALDIWSKDPSFKIDHATRYGLLVAFVILVLTTVNAYLPKNLIGEHLQNVPLAKAFNWPHRLLIGFSFVLPIVYFLLLYPFDFAHRRAFLFMIALGVLFSYASVKRIEVWQHFYSMPLHLCNTAMYIMPLTLAFHSHRLFYFTMFINVIGAFLALMMPNYGDSWPALGTAVMEFYINHIYAATLPVLIVELGVFERPKWKYFGYSMAGFACYFIFVAILNIYYTGTKTLYGIDAPDYFFINSDFIAKKVGKWAEDLWALNVTWSQNGYIFTLHWPYLLSYFAVYTLFALAMWYLYEILFASTDELILLHERKGRYKVEHLEFERMQERRKLTMNPNEVNHEPHLTITHFTKRYGNAQMAAVEDFSLDLQGGKIYGFLGKNGAGKSTIIKAIVGMHGFNGGNIAVCGYDVVHESVQAKEQIGFVPDVYALYENLTGRQYINYIADLYGVSKAEREERIPHLLERIEMREHYDDQMKTYSHGMKQKITIIAALVHEPKIWILDEPMTGVDPNSIFQIKECMREHAAKGNIVFFSSHLIDVVENLCDEIIIIKHGQLIYRSSMEQLTQEGIDLEALFLEKTADSEAEAKNLLQEEKKFGS